MEYKTKAYKTLIPKFLLSTKAVIAKAIIPIVNPLAININKSNHTIPFNQILNPKIEPKRQKLRLIMMTLNK